VNPRTIRRPVALAGALVVVLVVALFASGCSSTLRNAATIEFTKPDNTVGINRNDFQDELREVSKAQKVLNASAQQAGTTPTTEPNDSTVDSTLAANWLQTKIYAAAFQQMFDSRKLKVTADDRTRAQQGVFQSYGGEQLFKEFPKSLQNELLHQQELVESVAAAVQREITPTKTPTEADARAYYNEHKAQLTACASGKQVSHILVADQATANAILQQLNQGASFADLAKQHSTDTGSATQGGLLGCLQPNAYVAEFQQAADAAPLGKVVGPVHTQFGYHLILVQPFDGSFEAVRAQIMQQLESDATQQASGDVNTKLTTELNAILKRADVTLDPRYGTWRFVKADQRFEVQPPRAPKVRNQRERVVTTTTSTLPGFAG
jgi:parvulin-like peptidyl-prolyl isomerase